MSTIIPIPISTVSEERDLPSLTYAIDFDKGRILGRVDGLEAVNQAIRKALITPRFRCLIYDNQYGSELKQTIIAGDATPEYIEASLPGLVKDALSVDSRVLDVYDFEFSFAGEAAYIKFKADTIFGTTTIEEVI